MPRRDDTTRVSRSRARLPIIATALALLTAVSGCGMLGGAESTDTGQGGGGAGAPEKTKIKIGVLPVVDVAPLYQAVEKGYFKAEGLDVEVVVVASGPEAVAGMIGGSHDIAFASYPGIFAAQSKKAADLKIVADAYAARPGHIVLVSMPNSTLRKPEDVAGKKIAITAKGSMSDLAPMSVLRTKGVDLSKITWVQMGLPQMAQALQSGNVDGAVAVEPFVTNLEKTIGAVPVVDGASGPTSEMPMSGWAATAKTTSSSPNTIAAFQRGLAKAVIDVQDRSKLEPLLTKYIKIDATTAPLVNIADYPQSLDASRLQRVPDLMKEFGVITERLEVGPMLLPGPKIKN